MIDCAPRAIVCKPDEQNRLIVAEGTSVNDPGPVMLLRVNREPEELCCERHEAWSRQLDVVTRVASGEELPYATGDDGARNLEILEMIAP